MTGFTEDIIPLLPALDQIDGDRKGEAVRHLAVDAPGGELVIGRQRATRHCIRHAWPCRGPIGKKSARLQRLVAWLVAHVKTTAGDETDTEEEADHRPAR